MTYNSENTKTIVFGSVIATGVLAVVVFVIVLCWQIRRKAADYKNDESNIQYKNSPQDKLFQSNHNTSHINLKSPTTTPSTRSSASSFFNQPSSWIDKDFNQLINKESIKGVKFSNKLEFVDDHPQSPLSSTWSLDPESKNSRSSLAYLNELPIKPKPAANTANKSSHLTLMVDKDMVKDVLPSYYKDEDSVFNVYHERCKSLR
ncbi:hypothetical protein E3P81_04027 [Wallemia ichthyophaga]|nr:hypothetical protein E3P97_04044 [Wallemia ichthyophaga]TIB27847.1 hypothetical protein E3P85_04020 [Wallemia ichthyophaga]TIB43399.1 hypothetical protein E3P82_04035 [Wallemia ichthyophaga]TIB45497.1 hypothetical protein E3P81_04027 [Wallemia ichthyophaga]TIB47366.1 hypothetical protein E3P80_04039 [Wallemia ichthyophaga]